MLQLLNRLHASLIHEVIVQLHEDAPDNAQDLIQTAFTDH